MAAAVDLFSRNGFDGTSVDDIAAEAGVSKQTVYSHFGCKENLFGLAVSAKCKTSGIDPEAIDPDAPPEVMLPEIARRFLQLATSPEAIRVHNVCTGSAETHPELGRLFFKYGPEETVNVVAGYLEAQASAGRLDIEDPRDAAWQLLGMLKAESHMRLQFKLEPVPAEDVQAYVDNCVAMFLRAYAPRRGPSASVKNPSSPA